MKYLTITVMVLGFLIILAITILFQNNPPLEAPKAGYLECVNGVVVENDNGKITPLLDGTLKCKPKKSENGNGGKLSALFT